MVGLKYCFSKLKFKYNPNSMSDKGKLALDIIVATSMIPDRQMDIAET